jgi:hypothetical protein
MYGLPTIDLANATMTCARPDAGTATASTAGFRTVFDAALEVFTAGFVLFTPDFAVCFGGAAGAAVTGVGTVAVST